jgi:pimeloyl-ACP methyl ester carboxylesterase
VAADSDYFVPIEAARDLHDAIPGARWHEIRRCGHAMSLQCAEEFNQVLQKFYASI